MLKEEEEAELGCELVPVPGLAHTLHGTGAMLNRLVESKQRGISRGGPNLVGPPLPPSSDSFPSQLQVEAAGGWPERPHLPTLRAGRR